MKQCSEVSDPEVEVERVAELLGLDERKHVVLLREALLNPPLVHQLAAAGDNERFLRWIVERIIAKPPASQIQNADEVQPALLGRAKQALAAFGKWRADGLRTVPADQFHRRMKACEGCEHRTGPRSMTEQALVAMLATDDICALCACPIFRKALMATERCPAADPNRPGMSRWQELI